MLHLPLATADAPLPHLGDLTLDRIEPLHVERLVAAMRQGGAGPKLTCNALTLQEWMGHRDFKATLIYADNAPSAHETEMAERAFARGTNWGTNLSESAGTSDKQNPRKRAQTTPS